MKKLILVLAIALMACPAMALNVFLEQVDMDTLAVKYSGNGTTDATRMRAVALTITAPAGVTLTLDAGSYQQGESTAATSKYGIYPARINIDSSTGVVNNYGSPLADATDPGAGTGDGTNNVVLEFGSLYFADANAPAASGTLCTFTVGGVSGSATIAAVDEDTYRGGLVLENGDQGVVSSSIEFVVTPPTPVLAGTVTLQNLANAVNGPVGKTVTIQIYAAGGSTVLETVTATLGASGAFTNVATTRTPGTYDLKFACSHWLKKKVASVALVAGDNTVAATMLNGDCNADNSINVTDLGVVKTNFLKTVPVGTLGDMNEDGNVNVTDLGIIKTNFLKAGD